MGDFYLMITSLVFFGGLGLVAKEVLDNSKKIDEDVDKYLKDKKETEAKAALLNQNK
jgi:hypothetical protein